MEQLHLQCTLKSLCPGNPVPPKHSPAAPCDAALPLLWLCSPHCNGLCSTPGTQGCSRAWDSTGKFPALPGTGHLWLAGTNGFVLGNRNLISIFNACWHYSSKSCFFPFIYYFYFKKSKPRVYLTILLSVLCY